MHPKLSSVCLLCEYLLSGQYKYSSLPLEIMPQYCAVPLCAEKGGGHRFPKDKKILKQWLVAIRRDRFIPSNHSRICKKHFKPDDYMLPKDSNTDNPTLKLKPNTVPSLFSWNLESEGKKEIKRKRAERVIQRQKKHETSTLLLNTDQNQCEDHFPFEAVYIEDYNKNASVQCSLCKCEEVTMNTAKSLEHESNKSTGNMFQIENLKDRADIVKFYTGFDNYEDVMFIFNLFGDEVNHLKYYPSMQPAQGKHAITLPNQFFLTLIKLRRNMCNTELSFHFHINKTSVSKYFITWINYLSCKFKNLNLRASKETIDENVTYQGKTNTCTVIIDCTVTEVEKPQKPVSQQATCSNYKSGNTLKVLVGVSGSGCVNFVSDAYGGSISDRELFEKCGVSNLLQKGDMIPGDRGFNIKDLVSHKNATVKMSQILKKFSKQFDTDQLKKSKNKSSEHINVERVIGLGKTFKILSNKFSSDLVPLGGKIIFVCFMLANYRSK